MTDLPPPHPGQRPAPPPGAPNQPDRPQGAGLRRSAVVAIFLAVVVIAALVVAFATRRSDDDGAADTTAPVATSTATTGVTPTTDAVATTDAVETTDPVATERTAPATDGTVAESTTTAGTTTTTLAIPEGAVDLGHGVWIPLPPGWTLVSAPGEPAIVSDGATRLGVQVLARNAGEDVAALVQEYAATFDASFTAVGFGPTRYVGPVDAPIAIDEYATYYTTYVPGDPIGLSGAIDTLVRADGLSAIVDAFATSDVAFTMPREAFDAMVASFAAAPLLTVPTTLTPRDAFRVSSRTPTVDVDGSAGFTLAPGFELVAAGTPDAPHAQVVSGSETFAVDRIGGQADVNAVIAAAQAILGTTQAALEYDAPLEDPPDRYGVIHGAFAWRGQTFAGPSTGSVNYYFDPASGNAYVVVRSWITATDPNEPALAEAEFMLRSFYTSLTTIP